MIILRNIKKQNVKLKGFTTVEVVLAVAMLAIVTLGIASGLSYVIKASSDSAARIKAQYLADEGIEGTLDIKRSNFNLLVDGTYGISLSGNKWQLSGSSSSIENFTRTINITTTNGSNGEITKKIISTVTWGTPVKTVTESMFVTNWIGRVVSSWSTPALLSSLDITGTNDGVSVKVYGTTAFILRNGTPSILSAVNISNPAAPTLISQLTFSPANSTAATDLALSADGKYAYVTSIDNTYELRVINITNPAAMSQTSTVNLPGNGDANSVGVISPTYIVIGRAYSNAASQYEVEIWNVSNPALPTRTGFVDFTGSSYANTNVNEIYVSGNYAYLATSNGNNEMMIVNITNPAAPTVTSVFNATGTNPGVAITGVGNNYVFVARSTSNDFLAINVTTPSSPVLLGTQTMGGLVNNMAVSSDNKYLFLGTANTALEFQIWDISALPTIGATAFGSVNVTGTTATINGITYDSASGKVFAVGPSDTQELMVFQGQ